MPASQDEQTAGRSGAAEQPPRAAAEDARPQAGEEARQPGDASPQDGGEGDEQTGGAQPLGLPEWISFGVGLAIVLGVLALLTILHFNGQEGPPRIDVQPRTAEVSQGQGGFYLPVQVTNSGGSTAEDVTVQVTHTAPDGTQESVSFTVSFLTAEEQETAQVLFRQDPRQGEVSTVVSFRDP